MKIRIISERAQMMFLRPANELRRDPEKIPVMDRNAESGWPLFQVSLFTPLEEDPTKYEPALHGGNCSFFYFGAFGFAGLLTRIPGMIDVVGNFGSEHSIDKVRLDQVGLFTEEFNIHHRHLGFRVHSSMGGYGKSLSVDYPIKKSDRFASALSRAFSLALNDGDELLDIGIGEYLSSYTAEQIEAAVDPAVAIFSEGQIFADLGKFLEEYVNEPHLTDYFKQIFKIEEFMALKMSAEKKPGIPDAVALEENKTKVVPTNGLEKKRKRVSFFDETKTKRLEKGQVDEPKVKDNMPSHVAP